MKTDTVCADFFRREVRVAIYCRLSKDDDKDGTSESIQNQREMLCQYCAEQGWRVAGIFQDDGYTGLNMDRPDFQRMLEGVRQGMFDVVLTKDLSRLGRNYVQTGQLTEEFFPRHHVRYIALNDAVDTEAKSDMMMPLRNVLNEFYSQDISKKIHASYLTKAKTGKFTGCLAPFGYKKDPLDKNHLIIDEDTAWIVRKIFEWAKDGAGPARIRRKLEDAKIPCPTWWNRQKGLRDLTTKFEREDPECGRFVWEFVTVKKILSSPVYIGSIASQKSNYRFKVGWLGDKKPEDWIVIDGTHEPLIDLETFELVQAKIKSRKHPSVCGTFNLFAGLLKCGECGHGLGMRYTYVKSGKTYIYVCSHYNKYGAGHCTQHRIEYDALYTIVLEQIRGCARQALSDSDGIATKLQRESDPGKETEQEAIRKSISRDVSRMSALEQIIAKVYEDMVSGRITDDNAGRILERSQKEQAELKARITHNQERLGRCDQEQIDNTRWLELIRNYTDLQELDAATLNRLIQKIVVHEYIDGESIHQEVEIHFNFNNQTVRCELPARKNRSKKT